MPRMVSTAWMPRPSAKFDTLRETLPHAVLETVPRLGHFGLEGKSAPLVAERVLAFLARPQATGDVGAGQ